MSGKNQKILLIDDSVETIAYLTKALSSAGFEISTARNGADGLNMFDKIKPDVTLLNLLMPVMDGIETLRKILQIDHDAKVVITSAIDSHEMINRCLNKGAIAYIIKPIRCLQLILLLQQLNGSIEKRVNQMFLLLAEKLQTAGRKLYDPSLTVLYCGSTTSMKEVSPYFVDHQLSDIKHVKNPVESTKITILNGYVGYIGTITGQGKGAIVCTFKEEDAKWFDTRYGVAIDGIDMVMCKMFSILADSTRLTLDYQLPRKFKKLDNDDLSSDVAKAKFELKFPEKTISWEIQLWFNLSSI